MKRKISFNTASLVIIVILASVAIYMLVQFYGTNYKQALAAENPNDICATPAGYTDQEWRSHMSHHPDRYGECLR